MSDVQNKNRIAWVDVAKAVAMFFVLVVHSDVSGGRRLAALGNMFCVQLFFFMSGMFAKPEKYSLVEYIRRQLKALMLPYAVFSAINVVFYWYFNRGAGAEVFKDIFINIVLARRNYMLVASMWFLPCLFLVSVVYKLLTMAVKNKKLLLFLCFLAAAYAKVFMQEPILPFTANQALRFVLYFAAGDVLYPYIKDIGFDKFRIQNSGIKLGLMAYTAVAAILAYILYKKEYIIYFRNDFLFYSSLFINTVMLISLVVIISVLLSWCIPLVKAGQNTIGFCCLESISHTVLNTAMAVAGIGFVPDSPLKVVVFNIIAMSVSYIIISVINRFCPILFGKSRVKNKL